jgi:hypothetical protein
MMGIEPENKTKKLRVLLLYFGVWEGTGNKKLRVLLLYLEYGKVFYRVDPLLCKKHPSGLGKCRLISSSEECLRRLGRTITGDA